MIASMYRKLEDGENRIKLVAKTKRGCVKDNMKLNEKVSMMATTMLQQQPQTAS